MLKGEVFQDENTETNSVFENEGQAIELVLGRGVVSCL